MKNFFLSIPILITVVLFVYLPLIVVYSLIIHFTGQHYENWFYLILFLFLFCFIDMVVGTIVDSFLHAITDTHKSIFVNKLIASILNLVGTYIVIIALDYFFTQIDLSVVITIVLTAIHFAASLLFDKISKDEDDKTSNDLYQIDPAVESEIDSLLKTDMPWVDCVKFIKEKHPQIPKDRIIAVTRKIHMENKNSNF